MVTKYSIIQYVPNPIADERINIGAIAFSNSNIKVKFLDNWDRVRLFGMEDITFLQYFADSMIQSVNQGLLFPGDSDDGTSKYERLNKIVDDWINSIQFTKITSYLDTVENVLEDIAKTHLIEPNNFHKQITLNQRMSECVTDANDGKTLTDVDLLKTAIGS